MLPRGTILSRTDIGGPGASCCGSSWLTCRIRKAAIHEPERWEDETCNDSGDEKETDKWFHALETAPDTKKRHPGVPWRDYAPANTQLAVAFGMETPCGTYMCGCCQQWGRRIVFEPELPPPGREQDRWLAVAYGTSSALSRATGEYTVVCEHSLVCDEAES